MTSSHTIDGKTHGLTPGEQIAEIIAGIAARHKTTVKAIRGNSREASLVRARREAIQLLRDDGLSLQRIGELLNRDHTTIVYHIRGMKSAGLSA